MAGVCDDCADIDEHPGSQPLVDAVEQPGQRLQTAIATAAGDLSANLIQMTVASLGIVSLIYSSKAFFEFIKWAGVSYLIYMGISQIMKRFDPSVAALRRTRSLRSLYWQGFMTSAANPKAVIFFAALFPQFVVPGTTPAKQFVILGVTYLFIDGCFLTIYGGFSGWIQSRFQRHVGRHMNQISGALLVVAAILLGLKEIKTS